MNFLLEDVTLWRQIPKYILGNSLKGRTRKKRRRRRIQDKQARNCENQTAGKTTFIVNIARCKKNLHNCKLNGCNNRGLLKRPADSYQDSYRDSNWRQLTSYRGIDMARYKTGFGLHKLANQASFANMLTSYLERPCH